MGESNSDLFSAIAHFLDNAGNYGFWGTRRRGVKKPRNHEPQRAGVASPNLSRSDATHPRKKEPIPTQRGVEMTAV